MKSLSELRLNSLALKRVSKRNVSSITSTVPLHNHFLTKHTDNQAIDIADGLPSQNSTEGEGGVEIPQGRSNLPKILSHHHKNNSANHSSLPPPNYNNNNNNTAHLSTSHDDHDTIYVKPQCIENFRPSIRKVATSSTNTTTKRRRKVSRFPTPWYTTKETRNPRLHLSRKSQKNRQQ